MSYLLKQDASEDGATTQQQRQQTHKGHQNIEEFPRIILRCLGKQDHRQNTNKEEDELKSLNSNMDNALIFLVVIKYLLTVSFHVGVSTFLNGRLVLQTDLHFPAVCSVVHQDLRQRTDRKTS